ncbi:MAG: cation:proton antiporter [Phycisphaerales bacterium]|nr:cation:proton antiporter [Phycisphaerales bacterium]
MHDIWFQAALWLGLALVATLASIWLRISVALTEIVVGTVAQLMIGVAVGSAALDADASWVKFLAGLGAIVLTFLAGAELDPKAFRKRWREATTIGLVSFAAPFLGATAAAKYLLGWDTQAAWLAGVAMSTTSVAVVYAVMLELGLNHTQFGKVILAACFITDLGTVVALGLLFAPFTWRSAALVGGLVVAMVLLLRFTGPFFRRYGGRTSELEAKYLLFALFILGGLAVWAESEAVLPAYLVGMVLAGTVGRDHALVRRLRTLTFGLLTPFYFIRAGSLVQMPALVAGFGTFLVLLAAKMATKFAGIYPACRALRYPRGDAMYTTLLMSTGLTFGTISALYGLSHNIISQAQYSLLVGAVIASAVVPTWIANRFFLPHHHVAAVQAPEPGPAMPEPATVGVHRDVQEDPGRIRRVGVFQAGAPGGAAPGA